MLPITSTPVSRSGRRARKDAEAPPDSILLLRPLTCMHASSFVPAAAVSAHSQARRGRGAKHGRVQEFVSSCHVLSFSETPTGGGQTCVGQALGSVRRTRPCLHPPSLPACLLPAPVLSVRRIHPSTPFIIIFPELRKCWAGGTTQSSE